MKELEKYLLPFLAAFNIYAGENNLLHFTKKIDTPKGEIKLTYNLYGGYSKVTYNSDKDYDIILKMDTRTRIIKGERIEPDLFRFYFNVRKSF